MRNNACAPQFGLHIAKHARPGSGSFYSVELADGTWLTSTMKLKDAKYVRQQLGTISQQWPATKGQHVAEFLLSLPCSVSKLSSYVRVGWYNGHYVTWAEFSAWYDANMLQSA